MATFEQILFHTPLLLSGSLTQTLAWNPTTICKSFAVFFYFSQLNEVDICISLIKMRVLRPLFSDPGHLRAWKAVKGGKGPRESVSSGWEMWGMDSQSHQPWDHWFLLLSFVLGKSHEGRYINEESSLPASSGAESGPGLGPREGGLECTGPIPWTQAQRLLVKIQTRIEPDS